MICPRCHARYPAKLGFCLECDVPLVEGIEEPPPPANPGILVPLAESYSVGDLAVIQSTLTARGIPHFVKHEFVSRLHWAYGPARVMVRADHLPAARKAIAEIWPRLEVLVSDNELTTNGGVPAPPLPTRLFNTCASSPDRMEWLLTVPDTLETLAERWGLTLDSPFEDDASCSWVAIAHRSDGTSAVLKLGMPHFEATSEIEGLLFLDGDGAVRVLDFDASLNAMLLERCEPGHSLRSAPEVDQDEVLAGLLRRLWRPPPAGHPFRPLAEMVAYWSECTRAGADSWPDAGLVEAGLELFEELSRPSEDDVLLHTDLHAGNVLRAERQRWLVIDPKPFVGDRAYDATQHLFNCADRMQRDPLATIGRFADLLGVDAQRVKQWTFARAAAEPREAWDGWVSQLAEKL